MPNNLFTDANKTTKLGIVFGGCSSEYTVSLQSAAYIIDTCKLLLGLEIYTIGIDQQGRWWLTEATTEEIKNNTWIELPKTELHWVLGKEKSSLEVAGKPLPIDVFFPVLHGKNGEDGTVQGLWQLAQIPYVGCGVVDSSVSMDKVISRMLFDHVGIPQTKWTWLRRDRFKSKEQDCLDAIEAELKYPVFVKPANAGSSIGVSKAIDRESLKEALSEAFIYDTKTVIDEGVVAREIELAVLQVYDPEESLIVSVPGEIVPEREFYDFEAKYQDSNSKLILPTEVKKDELKQLQEYAKLAFRTVDAHGLCRADFFLEESTGKIYINEINTLPGFTAISMYPKLMQLTGIEGKQLMAELINTALQREYK